VAVSARARLAQLALSLLVASCTETTAASWRIHFAGDGDGGVIAAARVQLLVWSGGCDGTVAVYQADVSRADAVPSFGEIGEGTFGFEAIARDATCTIVARGCTTQTLPLPAGAELVTLLEPVTREAPLCALSACAAGICPLGTTDGGSADAATD
jgi:hypothetical protein